MNQPGNETDASAETLCKTLKQKTGKTGKFNVVLNQKTDTSYHSRENLRITTRTAKEISFNKKRMKNEHMYYLQTKILGKFIINCEPKSVQR